MPLNKGPVAASTAVATPPVAATAAAVAEKPKARSLKAKPADPVEAAEAAVTSVAKAAANAVAATVEGLQPSDMKPEQKRIQRSGIWQAVVQSNALVQYAPTLEAFLDLVDKAADRGLQYVNRP